MRRAKNYRLVLLMVVAVGLVGMPSVQALPPNPPPNLMAEVSRVFDGETIRVLLHTGTVETVRYIGLDAPSPTPSDCFGPEATLYNRDLVINRTVWLELDELERDSSGSLLAYVYLDPKGLTMVNAILIAQGLARTLDTREMTPNVRYAALFSELEREAQAVKRGLWSACSAVPTPGNQPPPPLPPAPPPGSNSKGPVIIEVIHYDAEGDDNSNLNGEWIILRANQQIALKGWTLADELGDRGVASHVFRFPEDFVLQAGQRVTIFTGCGTNTPEVLYWCARTQIWDNGEDVAVLKDAEGQVVDRCHYGDPDGSERGKSEFNCETREFK